MEVAHVIAKRATCMRRNVGAIIVVNRNCVSWGYNGAETGDPHCSGNECPGKDSVCTMTVHAERNAIKRVPFELEQRVKDLYVTDSPCPACAELLTHHRVKRVFFAIPYRITDSLDWLQKKGVEVYQVQPAGYVMEWGTRKLVEIDV